MNMETPKKWFVYINDHHEGPYAVSEVKDKVASGLVVAESFVWCDGMGDWAVITSIPELASLLGTLPEPNQAVITETKQTTAVNILDTVSPASEVTNSEPSADKTSRKPTRIVAKLIISFTLLIIVGLGTISFLSRSASEGTHAKLRPLFSSILKSAPFLSRAIRITPPLSNVSQEQLAELESAVKTSPEEGVKIAIILSDLDPARPFFHMATNLPTGTKFDITMIGKPETLLNTLHSMAQANITTRASFGRSEVVVGDGGQSLPQGEYRVTIMEAQDQEDLLKPLLESYPALRDPNAAVATPARFVASKTFFVGGPRNEAYLTRLKSFHDKLNENAMNELVELKQLYATLNSQFQNTQSEFEKIRRSKKLKKPQIALWTKSAAATNAILSQLQDVAKSWTPDAIQNDLFYGKIYSLVISALDSIKALVKVQDDYVMQPTNQASFAIQYGKAQGMARDTMNLFQTKLNWATQHPKTEAGLPNRDGL